MSKSEEKIAQILRKEKIQFIREKTYEDLRGGKYRFDFFLPQYNYIIEFNGSQHYTQVKFFQPTRKDFLKQQEHDRRKISYCLANNIKIFIIPYWELDNINTAADLFKKEFLATTKWHCDKSFQRFTQKHGAAAV